MSTNKIMFYNAVRIFVGIAAYFFLMKLLGLETYSELRVLNFAFVLWGINRSIKTNIQVNNEFLYIRNLATGIGTSALAVGMSIFGLIFYAEFLHATLFQFLQCECFMRAEVRRGANQGWILSLSGLQIRGEYCPWR